MKLIKIFFIKLLHLFTIIIISYFLFYKYLPRLPKEIFNNVSFNQGLVYLMLFLFNSFILIKINTDYYAKSKMIKKNNIQQEIHINIVNWVEKTYSIIINIILKFPRTEEFFLFITKYYIKIPKLILQIIEYLPRILLLITTLIDVFYFEIFYYTYKMLYLIIFTLISKIILYVSIKINEMIRIEIRNSFVISNSEAISKKIINAEDCELTTYNKNYDNVEQCIILLNIFLEEANKLYNIEKSLQNPLFFQILIRCGYILIWGYILFIYPLPIIAIIYYNLLYIISIILRLMPIISRLMLIGFICYFFYTHITKDNDENIN